MMGRTNEFRRSLQKSFLLHGMLLLALLFNIQFDRPHTTLPVPAASPSGPIIQAAAVDASQMQKELAHIEHSKQQEQHLAEERQRQVASLKEQANAMKRLHAEEQARLQHLKQETEAARIKREAEAAEQEKSLQALKMQQAAEKKKLADLLDQQKAAAKAAEALAQKKAVPEKKSLAVHDVTPAASSSSETSKPASIAKTPTKEPSVASSAPTEAPVSVTSLSATQLSMIDQYSALIQRAIEQQWNLPSETLDKNMSCQLAIHLGAGGLVLQVSLVKGSGNTALDQSAISAVYKASPLPVPADAAVFDTHFRDFRLTVHPEGYLA